MELKSKKFLVKTKVEKKRKIFLTNNFTPIMPPIKLCMCAQSLISDPMGLINACLEQHFSAKLLKCFNYIMSMITYTILIDFLLEPKKLVHQ